LGFRQTDGGKLAAPTRQLNQPVYLAHLLGWLVMGLCLLLHVSLGLKVGGVRLLRSMLSLQSRPEDSPRRWLAQLKVQIRAWLQRP
jgi:hypothetical protein